MCVTLFSGKVCIMQNEHREPTPKMLASYERRTNEHIERVRKCLMLLAQITDYGEQLIEMVCDWTAMAQEFGEERGSARGWADKVIGKRIMFNAERRQFIYRMIEH